MRVRRPVSEERLVQVGVWIDRAGQQDVAVELLDALARSSLDRAGRLDLVDESIVDADVDAAPSARSALRSNIFQIPNAAR